LKRVLEGLTSKISKISKINWIKKISLSKSTYLNLIQAGIGLSILLGTALSALGFYGLATGRGIVFTVGAGTISFDPVLSGLLTIIVGVLLTFEGLALIRISLQVSRLIIFSIILGYCALNIPAILLGLNYSLAAGIAAMIFGYLWLITILSWLQRGE
jgi:hypothetical protein